MKLSEKAAKNVDKGIKGLEIIYRFAALALTTFATIICFTSTDESEYAIFFGILMLIISILIVIATYNYIKDKD